MKPEGAAGKDPIRLHGKLEVLFSKILLSRRPPTAARGTDVSPQMHPNRECILKRGRQEGRKSGREMKKEIKTRFPGDPPRPTDTTLSFPD